MEDLPFYRRPISGRKVLRVTGSLVLAAAGCTLVFYAWHARPLNVAAEFGIETPAVPSPNAYDLYKQAHEAITPSVGRKPVAQVLDYSASPGDAEDPKKYPLAAKISWLQQNRAGWALFEQALGTQYVFPPIRSAQRDGYINAPYFQRWLAKYMAVECEVLAAQGQSEKSVQRALNIWQMALDSGHGAPLLVTLELSSAEITARRALDGEIAHLNGAQAARATRLLEKLLATREPYQDILQEERDATLFQAKPLYESSVHQARQSKRIEEAAARGEYNVTLPTESAPELRGPLVNWTVRHLSNEYAHGMNFLIADAASAWPRRQTAPPADLEPRTTKFVGVLQKSRFLRARTEALANLMLARLALHAYRKDKGVYPPNLESLVPQYLNKVPRDPFSENKALRYERVGRRYKLWSVGPDARDDNGQPAIHAAARTPAGRYLVTAESSGDIVSNLSR